jgi:hypothetical protein
MSTRCDVLLIGLASTLDKGGSLAHTPESSALNRILVYIVEGFNQNPT